MIKGLEALEKINHTVCLAFNENNNALFNKDNYEHIDCKDIYEFIDCYNIIEKELKELEERREMMKRFNEACVPMILDNETEKKLKAFEIIKIKKVDMARLSDAIKRCDLSYYNYHCYETLTQEEYEPLKEVLL